MNVVEWDHLTCREIGRELVAWLRQERMSPAWFETSSMAFTGPA